MTSFWLRRIKCAIYIWDIIFSKTHVTHLMASRINFFCQKDIQSSNSNFIPYHVRKLKNGNGYRPWHDAQAIARVCSITRANQEKADLGRR